MSSIFGNNFASTMQLHLHRENISYVSLSIRHPRGQARTLDYSPTERQDAGVAGVGTIMTELLKYVYGEYLA